jgi:tetratricopeptide (TPR) repeat protein
MDTLKKILLGIAAFFILNAGYAQDNVIKAFKESYKLEKEGKYEDALKAVKSVYKESSYEINLRAGWLAYLSGKFTESIAYYNNAVNKYPLSVEARLGLVLPLSAMGNWNQIIEHYNKILSVDPQNSLVNYRMGVIYYERKQYDKAESYLKKVINLYPFDHNTLLMLGWVKLQQGNYSQAKLLFNKTLMSNPDDASAKQGLSLIK